MIDFPFRILLLLLEFETKLLSIFLYKLGGKNVDLKINVAIILEARITFFNMKIRKRSGEPRPSTMKFHSGFESQCLLIDVS